MGWIIFMSVTLLECYLYYRKQFKYYIACLLVFIGLLLGYYFSHFSDIFLIVLCFSFYSINHFRFLKSEKLFWAILSLVWLTLIIINTAIATLLALLIFILLEYLHVRILKREEDKTIIYQNKLMKQQMDEIKTIYMIMRGWRHDYHNHLQAMKGYLNLHQIDEISNYLNHLEGDLQSIDTTYHSGNLQVDAILNGKLAIANSHNIPLDIKAEVCAKLHVSDIDLCVVIGNLLDNAIESNLKIIENERRFIRVYIGILKKQLYISITNATSEELVERTNEYFTTKRGDHGYGLRRVDNIIKKYDGYLKRANETGVFATEIVLPL